VHYAENRYLRFLDGIENDVFADGEGAQPSSQIAITGPSHEGEAGQLEEAIRDGGYEAIRDFEAVGALRDIGQMSSRSASA
jgi:hypothetical protein